MAEFQSRRSCRVAMALPIRVFGVDYRGIDFTEEALTIVVNLHGAKIRMSHQLMPDAEIRVLSHPTGRDSVFRVVAKLEGEEQKFTYWAVENLDPQKNIWGVDIPEFLPGERYKLPVALQCPTCSTRGFVPVDRDLLMALQERGGVEHICGVCNTQGLWTLQPCQPV